MPFVLKECTKQNLSQMNEIWDSVWTYSDVERLMNNTANDELVPIFHKYLPAKGRILEAGCGLGRWVLYLSKIGYNIIGVDFAETAIQSVKKYKSDIPVEVGNITRTRFDSNYFDVYISLGVLEHFVEGPFLALKEAKRILNKHGLLFVSVPVLNPVRDIVRHFEWLYQFIVENRLIRSFLRKYEYPLKRFVEYRYTISELDKILARHHFKILHKVPFTHNQFGLFNYFLEPHFFLRSKSCLGYKLSEYLAFFLLKVSPWIAPHQVLWICENMK